MEFIHRDLPPEWQWLGFVIAAIALALSIMTLPTVAQMIWGRPKIELVLDQEEYEDDGTKNLVCWIKNPPIKNTILSAIGVRRSTLEGLSATFSIYRAGSRETLCVGQLAFLTLGIGHEATVMNLPASDSQEAAALIVGNVGDRVHIIQPPEKGGPLPPTYLQRGLYDVEITVEASEQMASIVGKFNVGRGNAGLYWL